MTHVFGSGGDFVVRLNRRALRKRLVFPPSTCIRRIETMEAWKRARYVCGDLSQRSDELWS